MMRKEAFRLFREFDYSEVAMCASSPHRMARRAIERCGISAGGSMLVKDAWNRFTSSQPKEEQRLILITLPEGLDSPPKFQL